METAANTSSSHSPHEESLLDVQQVEQLREVAGDEGGTLLGELLEIVERELPAELARLQISVRQRNGTEVAHLGHRAAGTVASLGAVGLRRALHGLERAGREGDWSAAERILATLDHEWAATRAALQKIIQPPSP